MKKYKITIYPIDRLSEPSRSDQTNRTVPQMPEVVHEIPRVLSPSLNNARGNIVPVQVVIQGRLGGDDVRVDTAIQHRDRL